MTSSDRALEESLREALGEPMTSAQLVALDARMEQGRPRRVPPLRTRAMRRSLLLVAAVLVALPLAVAAGIVPGGDEMPPPADLENRVAAIFSEDVCVSPQAAEQQINAVLVELGYDEWAVRYGTGAATTQCVVASLDGQTRTVTLFMALAPEVSRRLAAVREQLYRECRTRDEATAIVDAALRETTIRGYRIEPGSLTLPSDREQEIERHVDDGCWVYSRTGWTADGTRIFWIAGK